MGELNKQAERRKEKMNNQPLPAFNYGWGTLISQSSAIRNKPRKTTMLNNPLCKCLSTSNLCWKKRKTIRYQEF
jgi:hypothetical protein